MMSELPAPLTPPDCDLRDFPYLPIDVARLFGSEFHALSTDAEWRAGFTLWLRSYHQVPAASLPADDVALARLAEFGRDVKAWRKVKVGALRGWALCSDGRHYHRVVAEKALEAWVNKILQRKASAAGNAKRYSTAFDPAPFDQAVRDSLARLEALNPGSRALAKRFLKVESKRTAGTPDDLPAGEDQPPGGSDKASRRDAGGSPAGTPDDLPAGSQEREKERGRGNITPSPPPGAPSPKVAEAGRGKPKGDPLPGDWTPKPAHYEAAAKLGRDRSWVDDEAEGMRAWAAAEAHRSITRKANWEQAFHNRLRESAKRFRPSGPPTGPRLVHGLANGAAPTRSTSGPSSARAGIAAALAAHREDPL